MLHVEGCVPEELREEYSPSRIKARSGEFGGIFRHVLPLSMSYLRRIRTEQANAVNKADFKAILSSGDPEDTDVSHYIMQYNVEGEGPERFEDFTLDFVNDSMKLKLEEKLRESSIDEKITALMKNDETGFLDKECPFPYEQLIADYLTSANGMQWNEREGTSSEWKHVKLKLKRMEKGLLPHFKDMETNVMYVSTNDKFPFVEFVYKSKNDQLVGFQITRQKRKEEKTVTESGINEFLKRIDLLNLDNFKLILVPLPSNAGTATWKMTDNADPLLKLDNYYVWKVPKNYKPT